MNEFGAIDQLLPHRHPMLLVDAVTFYDPDREIIARKAVSAGEYWLAGTERSSFPALLVLESWCQTVALLALRRQGFQGAATAVLLGSLTEVTLLGEAFPDDVVEHHASWLGEVGEASFCSGWSEVDGRRILEVGRVSMFVGGTNAAPATSGPPVERANVRRVL